MSVTRGTDVEQIAALAELAVDDAHRGGARARSSRRILDYVAQLARR